MKQCFECKHFRQLYSKSVNGFVKSGYGKCVKHRKTVIRCNARSCFVLKEIKNPP